jgi:hypothetical protein
MKINNYISKIKTTCDFNIEYDQSNKTFLFNNVYIDNINYSSFDDNIVQLKNHLIDVLTDVKKPQKFIEDILSEINKTAVWYETEKIFEFENFNKLSPIITNSINNKKIIFNSNYTLDKILALPDSLDDNYDDLLYYLIIHKSKTKNYTLMGDFQKVKLHYVITKYFESIYTLIEYLLMLDDIISKYGIEDYNQYRPIPKPTLRCTVSLSKIETANLFNAFFECGLFYFDIKSEIKQKRTKMAFLDNNFNYINQHGKIANVSNIIKEFGQIGTYTHQENQKKVIDSLIDKLKEIRPA